MTSEMVKAAKEYDRMLAAVRRLEERHDAALKLLDTARQKLALLASRERTVLPPLPAAWGEPKP